MRVSEQRTASASASSASMPRSSMFSTTAESKVSCEMRSPVAATASCGCAFGCFAQQSTRPGRCRMTGAAIHSPAQFNGRAAAPIRGIITDTREERLSAAYNISDMKSSII
eukprot:6192218-Pleurochrysis_carterae.AAC.2